ncbi:uncharacterized protein LOC120686558 isoform X2 [Panicum virgatum]|uniref:uncharacterized protein LOC120686558 isoform X2 n=1 Tax=Panicum virgatum TaxID=38727 RepID=UPI0019D50008|nr:uncharacterized protein LOC120686558 isoform X2 [Panicum virgatum]
MVAKGAGSGDEEADAARTSLRAQEDLGDEVGPVRCSTVSVSMAMGRKGPRDECLPGEGKGKPSINGNDTSMGIISLEHASALSSYPFMNPSFFNFHCLNQNGNGVLPHAGVNSSEIGDKANPVAMTTMWKQVQTKRHTTGNPIFAECLRLCRVPKFEHSAKEPFTECKQLNTRQNKDTRQTLLLPSAVI